MKKNKLGIKMKVCVLIRSVPVVNKNLQLNDFIPITELSKGAQSV
jgi:hypothetical protein